MVANTWPVSSDPAEIDINAEFVVYGARFPGGVKSGDVSALLAYLITQLHERVEKMMVNLDGSFGYGCTGYTYRAGFHDPSQVTTHGSGTAIDYNAPKHTANLPDGGWSNAQIREIRDIISECSGTIRWASADNPMHFEISGTPQRVSAAVQTLLDNGFEPEPTPPEPGPGPEPEPNQEITITQSITGAY